MKKGILRSISTIIAIIFVLSLNLARGQYVTWDGDNGFYPPVVVISPGDTVYWYNDDFFYSTAVSSDAPFGNPDYFSFYLFDQGDSGSHTFNNQGTFGYHSSYSDQGYVVVNVPPVVTITNPANNAVISAPASFTIQADASETPDDIVWDVEFLVGGNGVTNSIVDDLYPPFEASVTNLAAGTYTLIAIATDYYYATATNAITITVGGVQPTISLSAPRIAGNQFLFNVTGLMIGKSNVLQSSTNLTSWSPLKTNIAAATSATITNAVGSGPRYYRLFQQP